MVVQRLAGLGAEDRIPPSACRSLGFPFRQLILPVLAEDGHGARMEIEGAPAGLGLGLMFDPAPAGHKVEAAPNGQAARL